MNQKEYSGWGSIEKLEEIIRKEEPKKVFLVTGKSSYNSSGAQEQINRILYGIETKRFSDFSVNPKLEEALTKSLKFFEQEEEYEKCAILKKYLDFLNFSS